MQSEIEVRDGTAAQPATGDALFRYVRERDEIRRRRAAGQPPPLTDDPILQTYRFCNVRREDDKQRLHAALRPMVRRAGMPPLHAQDVQNCLCEFDKYERARQGEGRPKRRYCAAGSIPRRRPRPRRLA